MNILIINEDKKVQAIEMRFMEDAMTSLIILPIEGTDINKYINTLSTSKVEYNKIINGLDYVKIYIQLPKFEVSFSDKLNEVLADLGMYKHSTRIMQILLV